MENKIEIDISGDPINLLPNKKGINDKFDFYYDETNNFRAFWMKDDKFNSENKIFTLGGIALEQGKIELEVEELFKKLKLDKNLLEIKFKNIANGTFLECLNSLKLNTILSTLYTKGVYIHYVNLNPIYYSIVDIVDSIIDEKDYDIIFELKDLLYRILSKNIEKIQSIFVNYKYPDIKKEEKNNFLEELLRLIEKYEEKDYYIKERLIERLENAKDREELIFIMNEKKGVLIENFSGFYLSPIKLFKNSNHYLDEEIKIMKILENIKLVNEGKELSHYYFLKSDENKYIQLADIVIGLIGKYSDYLSEVTLERIEKDVKSLKKSRTKGYENLELLLKILLKSEKRCIGFFHNTQPISFMEKASKLFYLVLKDEI